MYFDKKRHKLLEILTRQRQKVETEDSDSKTIGLGFDEICNQLQCNQDELYSITSDLYTSEEIGYHNYNNVIGLFAKKKGVTAFANKKYKIRVWNRRKERIKFIVQTTIPLLALIVAILTLSIKIDFVKRDSNEEIRKLKSKLETQEKRLVKLEEISSNIKSRRDTTMVRFLESH